MKQRFCILFCCLLFSKSFNAQPYAFRHLTTADGLLSDLRLVITEDRLGRLWIGSEEGVNVFDGYQLNTYTSQDKIGLADNNAQQIFCDKQGTVWISTPSGIQYKKETDNRFETLLTGNVKIGSVSFFGETSDGDLLILTDTAAYRINHQFQVTLIRNLSDLIRKYKGPLCFEKFKENEWLIGFSALLTRVNIKKDIIIGTLPFRNTWCTAYVNDSTILAGSFTKDTVVLMNMHTGVKECINDWPGNDGKRLGGYAGSVCPVGENKYAISSRYNGVYIADISRKTLLHLIHDPSDPSTIKTDNVRRLVITRDSIMFVQSRALSYTSLRAPQFHSVKRLINEKGEKYDGGFTSFCQDSKNNFWISTNGLLARWNRQTNISTYYPFYDNTAGLKKIKTVRAVVADAHDGIWVGTFGGGLGLLKPDGTYQHFKHDTGDKAHSLPSVDIHSIATDKHRHFILCCNYGFAYFDPLSKKMQTFYNDQVLKSISHKDTYYAMADSDDNWWIGQGDGIFFYDRKKNSLHKVALPEGAIDKVIQSFTMDHDGNIYAGGKSGLFIIPKGSLKIKKWISKKEGLVSNMVSGLQCDKNGHIWIAGNIGLAVYNPSADQLQVFNSNDGPDQSNHNLCSAYMAPDGEMFIASVDGFNHFYPDSIQYRQDSLQVFVTSLELNDSSISNPFLNKTSFSYDNTNFSFSYMAVDFTMASAIQYRYKLEGFDTNYVYAGKQRTARYTNLASGDYRFIVEASANGKDWYPGRQVLSFHIQKAIWTTVWFRFLFLLMIGGIIYILYRNRIAQINKEAKLRSDYEIKLNELENSALRTQMNPHFIFNSLNTINSFINRNEPARANQYISKFSKLIRLILDHSRQKKISLAEELEVVELYIQIERIRFDNKFEYAIQIDREIDTDTTEIPPLILQPFVENAILHGLLPSQKTGLLHITLQKRKDALHCIVEDNGIGREQAKKNKPMDAVNRKSHGIDITLKRIELFNKEHHFTEQVRIVDLSDAAGNATGTRVEILVAWEESF